MIVVAGREVADHEPGQGPLPRSAGETKLDLVRYYLAVAEPLMRAAGGRPTLMQRFPHGAEGSSFFQKRVPDSAPEWLETDGRQHPQRHDLARARARRHGPRRLGREPRVPRLPRLAVPGRPPRGRRRAAARPRSSAGRRVRRRARCGRRAAPACSTSSGSPATRRPRATAASTSTSGSSRAGTPTRCGPPRSPPRASSSAAAPTSITAAWWKEERGRARVRRLQPERAAQDGVRRVVGARPSWRPGVGAADVGGDRRRPSRRADDRNRARSDSRANGDPWEAIADQPQSLEPLLELHERDRAAGLMDAPWPPVYPKQPDEPPRVAPSRARKS